MRHSTFAVLVCLLGGAARAEDIEIITPSQSAFRGVSEDAIAAIEYKNLGPAEWSGITGFEVAAIGAYVPTKHKEDWKTLTGLDVEQLALVGVRVGKGLPFNLDVAAFYSGVPEYGVGIYGAELRYAFLPGSTVLPAVAVRGTWDEVRGLDDFELRAYTVDASISKGFAFLTPYAGAGYVWGVSEPRGDVAEISGLEKENIRKPKLFVGMRMTLGLLHLTPEFETIGSNQSYNLNFGIHW
jgi:hypothetical protein